MRRSTDILIVCTIVLIGIFTPVEVTYAQSAPAQAAGKKPNIVFILVDNLGYDELGVYGGGILRGAPTPRIDKLASEGTRLLNFNVTSRKLVRVCTQRTRLHSAPFPNP